MFILTNISLEYNAVTVFDTSDGTLETVGLAQIAGDVASGKLKIYGLDKIEAKGRPDAIEMPMLGIKCSPTEARKALSRYYQSKGYSKVDADRTVGLAP